MFKIFYMINVQNYRKGFGSCPDCPVSIEFLLIHTGNVLLFFLNQNLIKKNVMTNRNISII